MDWWIHKKLHPRQLLYQLSHLNMNESWDTHNAEQCQYLAYTALPDKAVNK